MHGDEEAGQYRRIQNYVGDPARIKYTPCPPSEVPTRMREYVNKLQADMAENVKIKEQSDYDWSRVFHTLAQHHIEFEKIHPFIDGNGRTGRLLLTYEMLSMGLLPVDIRYKERAHYYAALSAYDSKSKYSTRENSKTEKMANLLAKSELRSMQAWINTFGTATSAGSNELKR